MRLYDTLAGEEREFVPQGDEVKLYVCGVTPYAPCHVGHAMSYVVFDVLRRYLEYLGYRVRQVQNFTDIDDKIIQRSQQEGVSTQELVERYIDEYFHNMDALNVKRAYEYPKATQEVPHIVEMISSLVDKGYAYPSNGDVYFRVTKARDYGKLGRRSLEQMIAGARVEVNPGKENPMDFTLWKAAKPEEPSWESPWGKGRPGWHIECSTISLKYLDGEPDIHGGGQDLVFPHHENEIAQSEAYTGRSPFAHFWVHNGLMQLGQDKMSKSLGNLVTVEEALNRYGPDALRLFFLGSHYRSPLTYSEEGLAAAKTAVERLRTALQPGSKDRANPLDPQSYRQRFLQAMDNDLNTPQALSALFDLAREINRGKEADRVVAKAQETLRELGELLGLAFKDPGVDQVVDVAPFIQLLIETREELRSQKMYDGADRIRQRLAGLGVLLEDTPQGTVLKYRPPSQPPSEGGERLFLPANEPGEAGQCRE